MKLTQFAIAAIVVLLAVAGYLTIKSDLEERLSAQNEINEKMMARMEELQKKQPAPVPSPPPAPPVPDKAVGLDAPADPATTSATVAKRASTGIGAPMAPPDDPRLLDEEQKLLNPGASDRLAQESLSAPSELDGQALSAVQSRIVALPAIARVKQFSDKDGFNFIVLDRGSKAMNVKPGDEFSLRRKTAVIGRIKVSDTIDTNECVADLVPGSMPIGMTPAAGDDVIQFD